MTDPFSISVGTATLLGAAGTIGKFLKKVIQLKDAPDLLLALNNEIEDLRFITQRLSEVLQQHSEVLEQPPDICIGRAFEKIRHTLLDFERLVAYKLIVPSKNGHVRLDKSVWLRAETDVQRLKDQIRNDKIDLILAINFIHR